MKIKKECLDAIIESAKKMHPKEFLAFLAVRRKKDTIEEFIILPQMIYGKRSSSFNLALLPSDKSVVGTAHSHPSGNYFPSSEDLFSFRKSGRIHIIIAYPYNEKNWKAYDSMGKEIFLEVV
ncbi:MAG: Mov34/MPN/PAD-1 family protein [Thermoplasmatales archaeon]|nr:Mov34/MPN/PAD-1 family protein [Thermoplasmatales archaeon]